MEHNIKHLRLRHQEVIRLAFLGRSNVEIAAVVGISPGAIACVLRSPIAQAEIARLRDKAEESITNLPVRVKLMSELNGAGEEAIRLNRTLMNDGRVEVKLRAKLATHFMDRVVFDKDPEDEREGSYRDILRKLDEVGRSLVVNTQVNVVNARGT